MTDDSFINPVLVTYHPCNQVINQPVSCTGVFKAVFMMQRQRPRQHKGGRGKADAHAVIQRMLIIYDEM